MYLNDATIYKDPSLVLNGVDYTGKFRHFLEALVKTRNLLADVIVNNHRIQCGLASFSVDSGYVIASINGRFALTEPVDITELTVSVHPANGDTLMESHTDNINTKICAGDTDVDIYFKVGSIYPMNELKFVLRESAFNALHTNNVPAKALADYPVEIEVEEPADDSDKKNHSEEDPGDELSSTDTSVVEDPADDPVEEPVVSTDDPAEEQTEP
jgi:hypothetical protein